MPDLDEILQKQLEAMESGKPLEKVLEEMPAGGEELAPLLQLASAVRRVAQPVPQKDGAFYYQQAATLKRSQNHRPRPAFNRPWMRPALGMVAVFATVVLLLAAGLWLVGPRNASAATLMDVAGQVEVAASDTAPSWTPVADGDQIHSGQRIRTGEGGTATLVFFEGSRATLGANTDLTLSTLSGTWGRSLHVIFDQRAGKTSHSVVPLKGAESAYQVQTPSGTASVRGTVFSVAVDKNGQARFSVDAGKVLVSSQNSKLLLAAGQATAAEPGELPQTPGYQFELNGPVESIVGNVWTVSGTSFQVVASTEISGSPVLGSFVHVEGRITGGQWIADSIETTKVGKSKAEFTGVLESKAGDVWRVSGIDLQITSETELDSDLLVGDLVKVKYTVSGQTKVALSIEKLEDEEETDTPTPTGTETSTPTGSETPTSTGTEGAPTETATPTGTVLPSQTITPTVFINCTGANPHPEGTRLAQRYGVPYEEIMGWFCKGFGFGEIDHAYSLSLETGVPVDQIFAMKSSGMGWGNIRKALQNITLTPSAPISGTLPTLPNGKPHPGNPHGNPNSPSSPDASNPSGQALAARYGVAYSTIMSWYNQGWSFNDIDKALSLSFRTGTPAGQILTMRASGMSWGQIQRQLSGSGKRSKKPPK